MSAHVFDLSLLLLNDFSPPQILGAPDTNTNGQIRAARLLAASGARALVNDAIYFQTNISGIDLGVCSGGTKYDGAFINTQLRLGNFRSGGQTTHIISCSTTETFAGTTPILLNLDDQWTTRGLSGPGPRSADDCLRLCNWMRTENTASGLCESWEWSTVSSVTSCKMWSNRVITTDVQRTSGKTGIIASGALVNANQANYVTSWKRSINDFDFVGRYKRDIWVEERSEDWMKPDLILPGTI